MLFNNQSSIRTPHQPFPTPYKTTRRSYYRSYILMILTLAALSACSAPPDTQQRGISPRQEYEFAGKVVSVDKARRRVNVEHEEIKGYMEAMTMEFALRDASYFDIIKPGDDLRGMLVVESGKSYLDQLSVVSHTPMDGQAATSERNLARPGEPELGALTPDFTLTDQDGKDFSTDNLRGRAVLMTFIYTRCPLPDQCPLMSSNFGEIARLLAETKVSADRVALLALSIDPEHDTPTILREYRARSIADSALRERVTFAVGAPDEIRRTANYFGLLYNPDGRGTIDHSLRTALIAPDGKLIKIYRGNEWKPAEVADEIKRAL
jgi:protein SCO1/2